MGQKTNNSEQYECLHVSVCVSVVYEQVEQGEWGMSTVCVSWRHTGRKYLTPPPPQSEVASCRKQSIWHKRSV